MYILPFEFDVFCSLFENQGVRKRSATGTRYRIIHSVDLTYWLHATGKVIFTLEGYSKYHVHFHVYFHFHIHSHHGRNPEPSTDSSPPRKHSPLTTNHYPVGVTRPISSHLIWSHHLAWPGLAWPTMSDPATQIIYLDINAEHDLKDPTSEAGKAWSRILDLLEQHVGFRRLYWGRSPEEPSKVQLHVGESLYLLLFPAFCECLCRRTICGKGDACPESARGAE